MLFHLRATWNILTISHCPFHIEQETEFINFCIKITKISVLYYLVHKESSR